MRDTGTRHLTSGATWSLSALLKGTVMMVLILRD